MIKKRDLGASIQIAFFYFSVCQFKLDRSTPRQSALRGINHNNQQNPRNSSKSPGGFVVHLAGFKNLN